MKLQKNGEKVICDVIATYHDDERNKDFIVYTDQTFDENQKLVIYYTLYEYINNTIKLIDIIEKEDKKIGLELIKEIMKDINKEYSSK